MEIGQRIKELRATRRMTAKELSEASGLPEKSIYKIESMEVKDPRISSVTKIAKGLNCSLDELVNGVDVGDVFRKLDGILRSTDYLEEQESAYLSYRLEKLRVDIQFRQIYEAILDEPGETKESALKKAREVMADDIVEVQYLEREYEYQ